MSMFNTCVSQLVKVTLVNEPVVTEWFNGTLFVRNINSTQAQAVLERLRETLGAGQVMVHGIGDTGEFAYDFI